MFGDFAKAEEFHNAVCHAHETHVTAMRKHQSALDALADNRPHGSDYFRPAGRARSRDLASCECQIRVIADATVTKTSRCSGVNRRGRR
ncbi:DUF2563 family protein [Streptomyces edwardsiae]|uniref:DUF2563 family protein n=1 Tax=Streptomyces edwardsiae TaxID=3075527 RepID=UPI0034D96504